MTEQTTEYMIALYVIQLETKVDSIIRFLSSIEDFNHMGELKSFVDQSIQQQKETIAEKTMALVKALTKK